MESMRVSNKFQDLDAILYVVKKVQTAANTTTSILVCC
jgi:hypothetical protein